LGLISSVQWNREGQNRLKWIGDDQQVYTVKSRYSNTEYGGSNVEFRVFSILMDFKDSSVSFGVCLEDTMG